LLEVGQGSPGRDRLDRGGHAGHATVRGLDLLSCGSFASACHQIILRCVDHSGTRLPAFKALLPDRSEIQAQRLHATIAAGPCPEKDCPLERERS
jgi:hypothetical protein